MKLYKVLGENGEAYHGGKGKWHLPEGDEPGKWMPKLRGMLIPCERGYHLCREQDLIQWLGPTIYEAEYEGEIIEAEDKVVVRKARLLNKCENWNERTMRLFACDCAERALSHVGAPDKRSLEAIAVARRYANGHATRGELDAAWAAAWNAAWNAARAAAWNAAWSAARAAAWDAAWAAAGNAERKWQTNRLLQYLNGEA